MALNVLTMIIVIVCQVGKVVRVADLFTGKIGVTGRKRLRTTVLQNCYIEILKYLFHTVLQFTNVYLLSVSGKTRLTVKTIYKN